MSMPDPGLTPLETDIMHRLAQAERLFANLPEARAGERDDFARSVNACRNILAFRVAQRVDAAFWRQPENALEIHP